MAEGISTQADMNNQGIEEAGKNPNIVWAEKFASLIPDSDNSDDFYFKGRLVTENQSELFDRIDVEGSANRGYEIAIVKLRADNNGNDDSSIINKSTIKIDENGKFNIDGTDINNATEIKRVIALIEGTYGVIKERNLSGREEEAARTARLDEERLKGEVEVVTKSLKNSTSY